jgi:hypothetical protein
LLALIKGIVIASITTADKVRSSTKRWGKAAMELRVFSRLVVAGAGLFMIVTSLNHLPSNLVTFMGVGLSDNLRGVLGALLFVPSLISLTAGVALVLGAETIVARAYGRITDEPGGTSGNAQAIEETAILLVGVYIIVTSVSDLGFYLFNFYLAHFQSPQIRHLDAEANQPSPAILFAYATRILLAVGLIVGSKNLAKLHRRIAVHRPMKDIRDI